MTAEQRTCPRCGQPFTWTTSAPRQKFCASRCRTSYNRSPARYAAGPIPPSPPRGTPMTASGTVTASGRSTPDGTITAVRPCPHCGSPVTAITWIVPPAAATVTTPLPVATRPHGP